MRQGLYLVLVIGCLASPLFASQTRNPAPAGRPNVSACSLLPRDLVEKVITGTTETLKYLKPQEQPIGTHGSFCDYGVILQVDPFLRHEDVRKSPGKDWHRVTGVGDTAYFRNNANSFAELMVWTGSHHFTIQMGIPAGGTADSVRPNTITLANAIIPKLR